MSQFFHSWGANKGSALSADVSSWDISAVTDISSMFGSGDTLSCALWKDKNGLLIHTVLKVADHTCSVPYILVQWVMGPLPSLSDIIKTEKAREMRKTLSAEQELFSEMLSGAEEVRELIRLGMCEQRFYSLEKIAEVVDGKHEVVMSARNWEEHYARLLSFLNNFLDNHPNQTCLITYV